MEGLYKEFKSQGVEFPGINANKEETPEDIKHHASEHNLSFTITIILCTLSIGGVFVTQRDINSDHVKLQQQTVLKIESINKEKLQDLIKNRNGKALLVNVWATWCGPCRVETAMK